MKAFRKSSKAAGNKNLLISGTIGVGTGFLGIGLPDIAVFTAMILKSLHETGLHYGFLHEREKENFFLLRIIQGAVTWGDEYENIDQSINEVLKTGVLPEGYNEKDEILRASKALSEELLYTKFIQGFPLIGTAGGIYDAIYMKKINKYAELKYHYRFLLNKLK